MNVNFSPKVSYSNAGFIHSGIHLVCLTQLRAHHCPSSGCSQSEHGQKNRDLRNLRNRLAVILLCISVSLSLFGWFCFLS